LAAVQLRLFGVSASNKRDLLRSKTDLLMPAYLRLFGVSAFVIVGDAFGVGVYPHVGVVDYARFC